LHPRSVINTNIGLGVMVVSIVLTLALIGFQRYVVKKTGSVAIQADSMHYKMDVLVNLGVIASLVLVSQFGCLPTHCLQ
jgi:ferrous-iron efflux pump FieF